ncbi:hypothetical protein [Agromyces sp. NPDC058110]|uniref:hypothetical protein n=1 Tax=Agromyces sp. NPDC058110 TaxID=3346345 RepID=UPI0036DD0757
MDTEAATRLVADQLSTEVYELVPPGDYFIGPEMIDSIANALVAAFVSGLAAGLKNDLAEWGKSAGKDLSTRIRRIFDRKQPAASSGEAGEPVPPAVDLPRADVVDTVQREFVNILNERGLNRDDAERLARVVRESLAR